MVNPERVAKADHQARVADRLRRRMEVNGIRQVEVARVLGFDPTQMSKYMKGHTLWASGLEDFEKTVGAAIEQAIERRMAAA